MKIKSIYPPIIERAEGKCNILLPNGVNIEVGRYWYERMRADRSLVDMLVANTNGCKSKEYLNLKFHELG